MEMDVTKLAAELVKQFAAPVFSSAKSLTRVASDKFKINFDLCFTQYLLRNYDRYSKTKTLLYRGEPVNLRDFYVRTDLESSRGEVIEECEVLSHIEKNQRFIVTGTAGSGKSTFCKSIFLDLIESPRGVFPIFIELRHLNSKPDSTLLEYILTMLSDFESGFSLEQLEGSLRLGKVLLIFDGFDEVSIDRRDRCEAEIVSLSNKYSQIMILLSSRPDYRFDSWESFYQYEMLPLDIEKATTLIGKLDYDIEVKEKFVEDLRKDLYQKHQSFAGSPLLLTMMLLTYEQIAEIPNKVHLFYEQAFLTLFNKHDSLKSLYKRQSLTGLPIDDFKKILSAFCALSYVECKYYFSGAEIIDCINSAIKLTGITVGEREFLGDLLDSVCIIQRDGLDFTFTHRSFQEYFTALFLVGFAGSRKFDLIDKVAFCNDRDDVVPMVYDINKDMLESEWIIPKLEKLIVELDVYPETVLGRIRLMAKIHPGVLIYDDDQDAPEIGLLMPELSSAPFFFIDLLKRIYSPILDYKNKNFKGTDDELLKLLERNGREINIESTVGFSDADMRIISNSESCERVQSYRRFLRAKLSELQKNRRAEQEEIKSLFFDE
ncbi:energy-coupling factor transporter ATP-binding protein EcfA2 [Pseudomonas sp. ADAK2 TE3594]